MDTQQTIKTLLDLKTTIDGSLSGFKAQSDALQIAIDQLTGILTVQATDLRAEFQKTIDTQAQDIVTKDQTITDLQAKLSAINPVDVTPVEIAPSDILP